MVDIIQLPNVSVGRESHSINCTITLSSSIGPDHSALNVIWMHNNQPISASDGTVETWSQKAVSDTFMSNLTLHQISEHDGGQYCCTANIIGNTTITSDCGSLHVITTGELINYYYERV